MQSHHVSKALSKCHLAEISESEAKVAEANNEVMQLRLKQSKGDKKLRDMTEKVQTIAEEKESLSVSLEKEKA